MLRWSSWEVTREGQWREEPERLYFFTLMHLHALIYEREREDYL